VLISLRAGSDAKADIALEEHLSQEDPLEILLADEIGFQLEQVDPEDHEAATRMLREIFAGISLGLRYDIARHLIACGPAYAAALKRAFGRSGRVGPRSRSR
jgi:hypothetical protein